MLYSWPIWGCSVVPTHLQTYTHNGITHTLQFLDLAGNSISAQGCGAVAEMLGANSSLYSLSLAGCPVRDDGAVSLAEALKSNIGLFKLDLSDTMVRAMCVFIVCD